MWIEKIRENLQKRECFMAQILIIDDSPMTRRIAIKILEPDGHEILEAGSGNEGTEIAVTKTPDCILLDLLMPGKDGREVLKTLKEKGVASPVIVLTSDIQKTTREECLKLGAFRFLNKPANENEIRRAVKEAITSTKGIEK